MKGIFYKDFSTSYIPNILKEIYLEKLYEPYLQGKEALTIVDCGANIGLTAQYFAPFAKQLYAIEPAKQHIEVLKHMLEFNKIDNVTVVERALYKEDGEMTFYHNTNSTMFSLSQAVENKPEDKEVVKTISLPSLFKEYNIDHVDFMKLDVEGAEQEIIGSSSFDEVASKIDLIIGEHHTWTGRNPQQLRTAFIDRGFTFKWLQADAQIFVASRI